MHWFSTDEPDPKPASDEDILQRSQSRPWLFDELVVRYEAAFLRKAKSIIKDDEDAKEIVQDAFTKIYVHANSFVPQAGASFSSWAYRILLNTAYTYYQKRIKKGERFLQLDPEFEHLIADSALNDDQYQVRDGIERILQRLPEHLALVLRLHYLERWPQQDIADRTGESVGTVKVRIHRAKAAFRKESSGEEVEPLW